MGFSPCQMTSGKTRAMSPAPMATWRWSLPRWRTMSSWNGASSNSWSEKVTEKVLGGSPRTSLMRAEITEESRPPER